MPVSSLSAKPVTMAEHAEKGHRFNCWCQDCGHNNSPSAEEMIDKGVPAHYPIAALEDLLKCTACGSPDVASIPLNSHLTIEELRSVKAHVYA